MQHSIIHSDVLSPSFRAGVAPPAIPPLRAGDRLTVEEFERRYEAMPQLKKAELIEGVVYMSPVIDEYHGGPHAAMITVLGIYQFNTSNVLMGDNSSIKGLEGENEPQADGNLRIDPACGGQTKTDEVGHIQGAPELIAEIAYTSASYDMHVKKDVYRKNKVQEYIVWLVEQGVIHWFRLRNGDYASLEPDADGVIKSEVFPGLWLHTTALITGDFARLQQVLQAGLASPEHAAFVQELARRRK